MQRTGFQVSIQRNANVNLQKSILRAFENSKSHSIRYQFLFLNELKTRLFIQLLEIAALELINRTLVGCLATLTVITAGKV